MAELELSYSSGSIYMELNNGSCDKEWITCVTTDKIVPSIVFLKGLERLINDAYKMGQRDQRAEIRSALGIELSTKNSNEITIS